MRIETVNEADLPELLPLMRGYCDFYEVDPPDSSLLAMSRALIADPEHEGLQLIARDDTGRALGFATIFWSWSTSSAARIGTMNDLFVTEEARGSGAADALIEECVTRCRRRGAVRLEWETALDNHRAQAVYDRVGGRREQWLSYSLPAFPHRLAGHCGSGAFRDLLEFHGLSWSDEPLSEAMAFGLGGGLGCFFYELPEMDPPLYLVGRGGGLEQGVCDHLGIELDLRRTDDPDEAWGWLRDELDAGRPTMVNADIKELDYLRVKLSNTMHDIVVTGYDDGEGVALIADNDREEIQRCSIESLQRARGSQGFPGPSHHATWVMRFPDALPDPRVAVERALRQSVANMTQQGEALAGLESGCGLDHVARLAESYPQWPARYGDRLARALGGLWVFIVKAGTGGAMFRSLQAGFLRESSELLDGDAPLARAAGVYEELAAEWVALADAAATARDGDPAQAHADGLPHIEAIARLEREGADAMARCLSAAAA